MASTRFHSTVAPTFVLVLGAWSLPPQYDALRNALQSRGITTECPAHVSTGCEPPIKTLVDDIGHLRHEILKLVDDGKNVIVLMHSYGGLVGSGAVEGLGKAEREKEGKTGGVILIVYMAAIVLHKGVSLLDSFGGQLLPYMRADGDYVHFVSDSGSASAEAELPHMPIGIFTTAVTYEPWYDIPSAFIMSEDDDNIPFSQQKYMAETMNAAWTYPLKSGHSPHETMPDKVADILEELMLKAAGDAV